MARKRHIALLVCALVGAGLFWWSRRTELRPVMATNSDATVRAQPDRGVIERAQVPAGGPRPTLAEIARGGQFNGTDYVRFNFEMKLRELAGSIRLTSAEKEKLTNAYLACVLAKAAVEAELVRTNEDRPDQLTLTIPPYPQEGGELKSEFRSILAETFAGERADEVDDHFGRYFDERLLGFGVAEQTIIISREQHGLYRIVRTTKVPAGRTLTGYREESPVAELQSTALLTYEQIRTGEYRSILPRLDASALRAAPSAP